MSNDIFLAAYKEEHNVLLLVILEPNQHIRDTLEFVSTVASINTLLGRHYYADFRQLNNLEKRFSSKVWYAMTVEFVRLPLLYLVYMHFTFL